MEHPSKESPDTASGELFAHLEGVLLSLKKTIKDLTFYPSTHPALRRSLDRTMGKLGGLLERSPSLTLTVAKQGFAHDGKGVAQGNPQLKEFALELYFRGVQAIHFPGRPSAEELEGFLQLLLLDPKQLREMGGLQPAILQRGITNLTIKELEVKLTPDQGGASAEAAPSEAGKVREPSGTAVEEADQEPEAEASSAAMAFPMPQEQLEDVDELLERWKAAQGLGQYQHIAEKLEALAQNAREARDYPTFFKILSAFILHTDPSSRIPSEWKDMTKEAIQRMAGQEGIRFLIDYLCREESHHDELVALLVHLGAPAASLLLERLKEEQRSTYRRRLLGALIQQGKVAMPSLLESLQDPRWYVVRDAAFVLGEFRAEEAIGPLARQLKHKDHRVRWEVVKALGLIGDPKAAEPLLVALQEKDRMTCQYAIAALGDLKEAKAAAPLIGIASKHKDRELRKAAIMALGQVGGPEALRLLVATLKRQSLFRRRAREKLRIAAAVALGMMGTGEAFEALTAQAEAASGKLRQACLHALRQRFKAGEA